jgi:hypothetical protein
MKLVVLTLSLLVAAFVGFGLLVLQPGPSGVVAHGDSPHGVRYVVTQQWNGWDNGGEPYTVRLYARAAGGNWQAYYIDHEARRWRDCAVRFSEDGHTLEMTGGDRIERRFDLRRGEKEQRPPFLPEGMKDEP